MSTYQILRYLPPKPAALGHCRQATMTATWTLGSRALTTIQRTVSLLSERGENQLNVASIFRL